MSKRNAFIQAEDKLCAHNYHPLPVVLNRGQRVWLYSECGQRYLDMMSAYSAVSHGHCHPKIIATLREQAEKLCIVSRAFHTTSLAPFLDKLTSVAGLDMALPMNTGAEAVETAIKAVRRYGYEVKGIPEGQANIIVAEGNFHGRTTTITSFSTDDNSRKHFGPFTPGFKSVPFGDAAALEKAIDDNTCAVLLEPIQGEHGIILPPEGYLNEVRQLTSKHNVLFVLDEIQSGLGRTGKWFAYQHDDITPDGLILGKALGGGVLPVSAFLANREVMSVFTVGSHGSTFGGNPLAAAVGLRALQILEEENLITQSHTLGEYLKKRIIDMKHPVIRAVRGRGLWMGIDIDDRIITGRALCEKLLEQNILCKETHAHTIRLAPPLVITRDEIDWALERFEQVLRPLK